MMPSTHLHDQPALLPDPHTYNPGRAPQLQEPRLGPLEVGRVRAVDAVVVLREDGEERLADALLLEDHLVLGLVRRVLGERDDGRGVVLLALDDDILAFLGTLARPT